MKEFVPRPSRHHSARRRESSAASSETCRRRRRRRHPPLALSLLALCDIALVMLLILLSPASSAPSSQFPSTTAYVESSENGTTIRLLDDTDDDDDDGNTLDPPFGKSSALTCDVAYMNCAYRLGCGTALQSYLSDCRPLIEGKTNECSIACVRSLISLMSTDEGQALVGCDCGKLKGCRTSRARIEPCMQEVSASVAPDNVVSCSIARIICLADPQCAHAMEYTHAHCQDLFRRSSGSSRSRPRPGRGPGSQLSMGICTQHCNNSISILYRQEKASKLASCTCDGNEDFPCRRIKYATERLCFGRQVPPMSDPDNALSLFQTSGGGSSSSSSSSYDYDNMADESDDLYDEQLDEADDFLGNRIDSFVSRFGNENEPEAEEVNIASASRGSNDDTRTSLLALAYLIVSLAYYHTII